MSSNGKEFKYDNFGQQEYKKGPKIMTKPMKNGPKTRVDLHQEDSMPAADCQDHQDQSSTETSGRTVRHPSQSPSVRPERKCGYLVGNVHICEENTIGGYKLCYNHHKIVVFKKYLDILCPGDHELKGFLIGKYSKELK